ncbi:hypothetical protein [Polyangium spumosum]|uniref:Tryptophan synthase alpha chain n=1 Tax=Polyangium spumosum TaxID=889282 RepID=A0A6N7Q2I3_9BACT|nr:hypothetical protein [Polyangium spumosum]MRG98239.1 hypothetical protein [Polyangium spumosum]
MNLHRFVAALTFTLLLPAFFALPSCTDAACADGGEGCPCTTGVECGRPPMCTGWICDGTCRSFNERVGFRCVMDSCPGPDKCPGVCDGAGTCIGCLQDADCKPGHTCEVGNVCSRCDDEVKNGDETDVDCGGSCPLCPGTCNVDADCPGGYCWDGLCVRCDDGIQNGDESGVDCGSLLGHCPVCTGYKCETDEQCATGICAAVGVCCKVVCDGCQQCEVDGECVPIAGPIPWADCLPGQLCGLGGTCVWKDGYPCTKNEDCFNLVCSNGICGF